MDDVLMILVVVGGILLIIAVVGHGMWVAVASLFRLIFRRALRPAKSCRHCAARMDWEDKACARCGWSEVSSVAAGGADLEATARQLERFFSSAVIDRSTYDTLCRAIENERRRQRLADIGAEAPVLLGPPAAAPEPVRGERPEVVAQPAPPPPPPPIPAPVASGAPPLATHASVSTVASHAAKPADTTPQPSPRQFPSLGQPVPSRPAAPPRKPLAQVFAAFMEEKNIRWGELVGGLLVVGCSIALVVKLWATIEQIHILKYFLFPAVTSAFFGVGLHTEHRWKLPTTSRGVLLMATLMVPLSFLAGAALSRQVAPNNLQVVLGELVSFAVFVWLTERAGRVLVPGWSWALAAGVLGSSLAQLAIRRLAGPDLGSVRLIALGLLPLACYGGTIAWMLHRARAWREVTERGAHCIFVLLGTSSFAALLAVGLLVYVSTEPARVIRELAPLVSLAGLPALACGLYLWQRVPAATLATLRTIGTSVAVAGAGLLLAGILVAWPHASRILPVALLDGIAVAIVAVRFRLPAAHLPASVCFAIAYLVAVHLGLPESHAHRVGWSSSAVQMATALVSGSSGAALTVFVVLLGGVSEWLRRAGRAEDAHWCRLSAAGAAFASLGLVTWFGFARTGDPYAATWVYVVYAAGALFAAWQLRQPIAAWIGSTLVLAALVQGIVYEWLEAPEAAGWQLALFVHATTALLGAAAAWWLANRSDAVSAAVGEAAQARPSLLDALGHPLGLSAIVSSWSAIGFGLYAFSAQTGAERAGYAVWLAAIWFAASALQRLAGLFSAAQFVSGVGVWFAVSAVLERQDWYAALRHPKLDPWTLQIQFLAIAVYCMLWVGLRLAVRRVVGAVPGVVAQATGWRSLAAWLLFPPWPPVDRLAGGLIVAVLVALAAYGVVPSVALELGVARLGEAPVLDLAGISHVHALGVGSWLLLVAVVAVLVMHLWEQFERWTVYAIMLALAMGCALWAGRWEPVSATASALRWSTAGFFLIGSLPFWFRGSLSRIWERAGWWRGGIERIAVEGGVAGSGLVIEARTLLLVLSVVPVLALTMYPALVTLQGAQIADVASQSFFGRIGRSASYVVPLLVVFLGLAGHATRERSAGYALGAGAVLNLTVSLGYLLAVVTTGGRIGLVEWIHLLQWNAGASAGFALLWLFARGWSVRTFHGVVPERPGWMLGLQVSVSVMLNALVLFSADCELFLRPVNPPSVVDEAGSLLGGTAILLSMIAVGWLGWSRGQGMTAGVLAVGLLAVGSYASFAISRAGATATGPSPWLGYTALQVSRAAAPWLILGFGWLTRRAGLAPHWLSRLIVAESWSEAEGGRSLQGSVRGRWRSPGSFVELWSVLTALVAVVLAFRSLVAGVQPGAPWWSVGAIVSTGLLMAGLARYALRRGYLYWAAFWLNVAATIWWVVEWGAMSAAGLVELAAVNVIVLAVPALAWLALELEVFRRRPELAGRPGVAVHHAAALFASLGGAGMVAIGLVADGAGFPLSSNVALQWVAVVSAAVLMAACLWDPVARYPVAGLYMLGLVSVGLAVDQWNLEPRQLGWTGLMILAAYGVGTSYLWSRRGSLQSLARVGRMPPRGDPPLAGHGWLLVANQLLAIVVVVLAYGVVCTYPEYTMRLSAAKGAMIQGLAIGLLAQGSRRPRLQQVSLALVVVGAVAWGWAWLHPETSGNVLNRAVVVLTVLAASVGLYGLGLVKFFPRENDWTRAAQSLVPALVVVGTAALVFVLAVEGIQYEPNTGPPMGWAAKLAVAVALAGLIPGALVCALVPGRDPLQLTERGRMFYVYAAEVLGALLFMHIRLTMPWLFTGWFTQYWTLVIMALAFLGTGVSELLRRQNRLVLAEPLERTGAFLPILPVISLWILPSQVHYTIVLVAVSMLYGVLSVTRKSFGFGVLAAIAGNGGLWYYLHRVDGLGFMDHPQLWLIPAALSLLVAAYLNRDVLGHEQFVAIRYVSIVTVYVASTADIFMNGVADAPWLPLVLMGLSVLGILGGMAMRVRAFLFLGSAFLLLSLITMIRSAQVNLGWTWLWWVAGIWLGILIITMFALFEKKRNEVLLMVDRLKEWER